MSFSDYLISTPENVDLHLELAGTGNRILACLVDTLITYFAIFLLIVLSVIISSLITLLPITYPFAKLMLTIVIVSITIIVCFVVYFGYFIFFEGIWQGQTPGKKIAGIRVIEQNGQPVSLSSVWIRNLVRILDEGLMLIGLLVLIIDRDERRLGDLAANTIVIRERKSDFAASAKLTVNLSESDAFDTGHITPSEYELLLSFLKRRQFLDSTHRTLVSTRLAEYFTKKLDLISYQATPEPFLEKLLLSYRLKAGS